MLENSELLSAWVVKEERNGAKSGSGWKAVER